MEGGASLWGFQDPETSHGTLGPGAQTRRRTDGPLHDTETFLRVQWYCLPPTQRGQDTGYLSPARKTEVVLKTDWESPKGKSLVICWTHPCSCLAPLFPVSQGGELGPPLNFSRGSFSLANACKLLSGNSRLCPSPEPSVSSTLQPPVGRGAAAF